MDDAAYFREAHALTQTGEPFVAVTLVATRGHAPQEPGAKLLVTRAGLAWGTVGGGRIEAKTLAHAQALLEGPARQVELVTWNLQRDVGMSCGGEVELLFERLVPRAWRIAVFGAGHVSQALVRQLLTLECHLTCIDTRPEWLARLPEPSARFVQLACSDEAHMQTVAANLPGGTFCVVMTRGHATDLPVLEALLKGPLQPYVGVIGSTVKGDKLRRDLRERGVTDEAVGTLRCPMGLPIGNRNEPAEIAISITAELIQRREALKASE